MPTTLICCISLPPAIITSIPIFDLAQANEELENMATKVYYPCCGKNICGGCFYSFRESGNSGKCPFCNERTSGKTAEETVQEKMKRVEAKDAGACVNWAVIITMALEVCSKIGQRHLNYGNRPRNLGTVRHIFNWVPTYCHDGGDLKRAKFHYEAAAMAGHGPARSNLGLMELKSGNMKRAVKHWIIAASAGNYGAMYGMITLFTHKVLLVKNQLIQLWQHTIVLVPK
jgi:hypothetical protein